MKSQKNPDKELLAALNELDPDAVLALHEFVEINIDSSKGFDEAASLVADPSLESAFRKIASVRRGHVEELQGFLVVLDAPSESTGTILAAMHRWWLDLRAWLTAGDAYAMLAEVECGEDAIKEKYRTLAPRLERTPIASVLQRHFSEIRETIADQCAEVRRTHDRMRDLRDECAEG